MDKFINTIVMYTISKKRQETRNKFYELLQEKFCLRDSDKLNESAYHIHCKDINYIVRTINEIITQIIEERLKFGDGDFVDIYYAAHLKNETYRENLDDILRDRVYPPDF